MHSAAIPTESKEIDPNNNNVCGKTDELDAGVVEKKLDNDGNVIRYTYFGLSLQFKELLSS